MEINDPRIDAYLNGDLLQEEIAAFETEAKQSPETWEHIQFQQFMIEGIRREGAAELKDFIANRITEDEQNERNRAGLWWSIAATFVVLAVGLVINYKSASRTLESKMTANNKQQSETVAADSAVVSSEEEPRSDSNTLALRDANAVELAPPYDDQFGSTGQQDAEIPLTQEADDNLMAENNKPASALGKKTADNAERADNLGETTYLGRVDLTPIHIAYNNTAPKKFAVADTIEFKTDKENSRPKAKLKAETPATKQFTFMLLQDGAESPQLTIGGSNNNQTSVTLWNAGSMDILLFEINQQLYLQLGNQYYFFPMNAPEGVRQKLTPVTNANMLKTLRNR